MNSLTKILVVSAGAFVAVILLVLFLAKPILGQISSLHDKELSQRAELGQLDAQLKAYNLAKNQLKEVNFKESIDGALVKREDLALVLAEVEADAAKSNISESIVIVDDLVDPKQKPKTLIAGEKTITEVPYTLNFTGAFGDTVTFIQYLENLSHFTEVSNLSFNATSEQGSKDQIIHTNEISGTISGVFFIKKK